MNVSTGIISTVAGNGNPSFNGDNIAATAAELNYPEGVAVDVAGNIYIADSENERVREVNVSSGLITTVAGDGKQGYSGDNGQATAAELWNPRGIALDGSGDLFIADAFNDVVREVNLATGKITTVAGTGTAGYTGNGALQRPPS